MLGRMHLVILLPNLPAEKKSVKQGELQRQLMLLDAEREERVETSTDKVGVFLDSVRRSRWTLSEDRRSGKEGARTCRGSL